MIDRLRFKKEHFLILSCALALIFSGCSKGNSNVPNIERNLENDIMITENNQKYEAHITYIPEGIASLTFKSPENLANTVFEYKNGKYIVSNKELSGEYNLNPFEKNSSFSKIMDILGAIGNMEDLKIESKDDDILSFKVNFENSEYIITSTEEGKILSIENAQSNFKVEFVG